jgi:chromosome segregation ATPase
LEREYARMPKPHELERQIEQLKHQNKELTREIAQRQEEIIGLKKSIEVKNVEVDQKKKELNELLESVEDHKNEYVNVNLQPYQIAKEIDKLSTEKE